jgi:hypothetical protein
MHFGSLAVQGGERGLDVKQCLGSSPELFVGLDHSMTQKWIKSDRAGPQEGPLSTLREASTMGRQISYRICS